MVGSLLRFPLPWLLFLSALVGHNPSWASDETTYRYRISRDDTPIGTYQFLVSQEGEARRVDVLMRLSVKVLGLPVYEAVHQRRDLWSGPQLVSLSGVSTYNKKRYEFRITQEGRDQVLQLNGTSQKLNAPFVPFVPWQPPNSKTLHLLTEKGRLTQFAIQDLGTEVRRLGATEKRLAHYRYRGEKEREAWYDAGGVLELMTYEQGGAQIRIERIP